MFGTNFELTQWSADKALDDAIALELSTIVDPSGVPREGMLEALADQISTNTPGSPASALTLGRASEFIASLGTLVIPFRDLDKFWDHTCDSLGIDRRGVWDHL